MPEALEDQRIRFPDRAVGAPRVWVEPTARRVRAVFGGVALVDSTGALLLFETEHLPVYYVPIADVRMDLLTATGRRTHCPLKGDASYWTVTVGDRVADNAVWGYPDPLPGCPDISRHMALYWNKMDAWYEEDDEVFVHPRSPYHRVDVLSSSRHVRVVVAGETVAETRRPRLLFETGLPTRYYLPKADVRMDLLEPTATVTQCPYKGKASYWSARVRDAVVEDIAWSYPFPIPECPKIEQLVAFYNERVEALYVDGELQPVPQTPWSKRPR